METFVARARKWGNSKGVVLPAKLGIGEGEELELTVIRTKKVAKVADLFGKAKLGGNTQEILDEIDKETDSKW